jgi:transposase
MMDPTSGEASMDPAIVEAIYRLSHGEHWSIRKIARHLKVSRATVRKYRDGPVARAPQPPRGGKLDGYKQTILDLLEQDPQAAGSVILQHLRRLGYDGGVSILRDHLRRVRRRPAPRAFLRMEPLPGERFEVDWGHFGALDYEGDRRKLYAFVLVECHSRLLYVEFTHSQRFETFARCHIHAFRALGGVAREIWYDNLLTAVAERDGRLVRFQPRFLAFARQYNFYPRACNPGAGWEKGTVERAGVRYLRQSFWPLRAFRDLADVNRQVRGWLEETAHRRVHRETRRTPRERFRPEALRPLPALDPDYRDGEDVRVYKDLRVYFDGNRYCAPPRFVERVLSLKADSQSVTLYDGRREVVSYARCWRRGQVVGADRFREELLETRPAARASHARQRLTALLGPRAETYLRALTDTDRSLSRQVSELLELVRLYGPEPVGEALEKAQSARAYGADYIANLLLQQGRLRQAQPPLRLKDPRLNQLHTDPLSLLEYDALILEEGEPT